MNEIKEVLVVEGKNDTKHLKSFFKVDTIETSGSRISKKTIELIKEVNQTRGVILLLDPDSPGEKIRKTINESIPGLKNAFLFKQEARTKKKVGIEHADKEVIEKALENLVTYGPNQESIDIDAFYDLGLLGQKDALERRMIVSRTYHLGKCNGKTMLKRLNMLGITKEELQKILKEKK